MNFSLVEENYKLMVDNMPNMGKHISEYLSNIF